MTFYHFGNCMALAYFPYYLAYKYSGLSEYGAFWKCVQTGFIYALTQLFKMILLATFFPVPGSGSEALTTDLPSFIPFNRTLQLEFFKESVDLADLIGMYVALSRIPGRGHSKVLTAGIGWGTAELALTRVLAIWVGAKGAEFNWKFIQMSLDANICLIQHITLAALVWLWSRRGHDPKNDNYPMITGLAVFTTYKSLLVDFIVVASGVDPWTTLLIKAGLTIVAGAVTLRIYSAVATS